jgi:phage FluMu protein Com
MSKSGARTEPHESEIRCTCGSLLARLSRRGVEVKCRRCKRVIVIPVRAPAGSKSGRDLPEVGTAQDDGKRPEDHNPEPGRNDVRRAFLLCFLFGLTRADSQHATDERRGSS